MKYLSRILFIAGLAACLAACNDVIVPDNPGAGDMKVNLTVSLADRATPTKSKVSGEETVVTVMQLVCFDANGQYLGIRNAEVTSNGASGQFFDTGVIKGSVPQGTARIHFIANRNLDVPLSFSNGTAEEVVMKSMELSTKWDDTAHNKICYWGYHKEANDDAMKVWLNPPQGTNNVVYMIRDRAKVVLTYNPAGAHIEVTKIEWLIHNGRERGYIAPAKLYWNDVIGTNTDTEKCYFGNSTISGNTSIVSTAGINEYTTSDRYSLWRSATDNDEDKFDVAYQKGSTASSPQFLFDDRNTDIDNVKVILRVTYQEEGEDPVTVYHTLRLNDDDKVKYPVVRNNTYYIKCSLLSPDIAYYETLKEAIDGEEFVNADVEIDRSITDINDDDYTLQILLPTETTSIVLNEAGDQVMHFAFRTVDDVTVSGTEDPDDFEVYWENEQDFCSDPTLTYNPDTKQFEILTVVDADELNQYLKDEWIVVKHKESGLTRYIHVFVIDQFRYRIEPSLKAVQGSNTDYVLNFQLPPAVHSRFIEDEGGNLIPDPTELIYPESLYPIEVKFATNTLNAYGVAQGVNAYGLFGVAVEGTSNLLVQSNFEPNYNIPYSSTNTADMTHWYYQQAFNYWDFWYTYSLKEYPDDGMVNIYLKDVTGNIKYATVNEVGLFLNVNYFGKIYSVPVTQ